MEIGEITKVITKNNKVIKYEVDLSGLKKTYDRNWILCTTRKYDAYEGGIYIRNITITSADHIIVSKHIERVDYKSYYLDKYISCGQFLALLSEDSNEIEKMSLEQKIEYGFKKWLEKIEDIKMEKNEVFHES